MRTARTVGLSGLLALGLAGGLLAPETATAATAGVGVPGRISTHARAHAVDLAWRAPIGARPALYEVRYRERGATDWSATASTSMRALRLGALTDGATYQVEVRSLTDTATGAWSSPVIATPTSRPGQVTRLSAAALGGAALGLRWAAPALDGGRRLTGYDVRYRRSASGAWHRLARTSRTSVVLPAAAAAQVRAANALGAGEWTEIRRRRSAAPAPRGLVLRSVRGGLEVAWRADGDARAVVRWVSGSRRGWIRASGDHVLLPLPGSGSVRVAVAAEDGRGTGSFSPSRSAAPTAAAAAPRLSAADGGIQVTRTTARPGAVRYRVLGATRWMQAPAHSRSVVLRGLRNGSAYVVATRTGGAWSAEAVATPAAAPSAPTLRVAGPAQRLETTWRPTAEAVLGYDLRYRAGDETGWTTRAAAAAAIDLAGLPGRSTYRVQVRARTATGAGPWSRSAAAYVPALSLPVLDLATDGDAPIVQKDVYLPASLSIASRTSPADAYAGTAQVKGHGNSTWPLPKKPYRLKLDAKASLLGMPASKHWVLLANAKDGSHLRNDLSLHLGQQTGLAWTPQVRWVELLLNGRYEGLYQLAEQVRVDPTRVAVDPLSSKDVSGEAVTGGYLLELDHNAPDPEDVRFTTATTGQPITVKDPEAPTTEQLDYIRGYVDAFEAALYSDHRSDPTSGYARWIDVDSFVDWYVLQEYVENQDAMFSSAYLTKPRGGKLMMGPLWDFDLALRTGGRTQGLQTTWYVRPMPWWSELTEDPAFEQRVRARWRQLKPRFDAAARRMEVERARISDAAGNDEQRWGYRSHDAQVAVLFGVLAQRAAWLDARWRS